MKTAPKGHKAPLLFTQSSRDRVLIAISWDERQDKASALQRLTGSHTQHDLDLSCFVYDSNGAYIDFVGAMAQDAVDETGAIYHSGDDATGEGLGDDESISCELAGLPRSTTDILFVCEIRSGHLFGDIADPRMRIADGMTDTNLLEIFMNGADGADKPACILARITRDNRSPTGWSYHAINDYPPIDDVSDWGGYLTRYLK
ncbi:MAG: TerD family protein [Micavibrio sp.]